MLLNRIEYLLMNNPVRAAIQRHYEVPRLLRMGGAISRGHVLEVGCGRGIGTELILDSFGADRVDAFDLDPTMITKAKGRLQSRGDRVRLWVGDAAAIAAADSSYDAVFDFAIIHHVPNWRDALKEVYRVLKPGGRFYAEEVLRAFIVNPMVKVMLDHPEVDRFDSHEFSDGLRGAGLTTRCNENLFGSFGWFVADKPADV